MDKQHLKVNVVSIRDEAPGIRAFSIARADGCPFDQYEPGAHIDVHAPSGVTRQYSLCGDPSRRELLSFAVKREDASRGGSRSLHDDVYLGTELTVSLPRNLFQLAPEAQRHILIAAGIGITPLLNMAYRLIARKANFVLHYFVRSKEYAAFVNLLSAEPFANHVRWHVGTARQQLDVELDHELAVYRAVAGESANVHLYTCGPAPFMDRVIAVAEHYLPPEAIHLERFGAGSPSLSSSEQSLEFEVELARSGQVVRVASGISIVAALAAIGVEIDTSCGEGVCGTCMVDVVSGEPDHRDHCLSKAERASGKMICCCVSRARSSKLVLDL